MRPALAIATLGLSSLVAHASETVSIIPSDDGYIVESTISTEDYVITGAPGDIFGPGIIEFPTKDVRHAHIDSAFLAVNPYGLPLHTLVLNVYGYESKNGKVDFSDATAGVLLGQWELPEDLDYGEEVFFDVTGFMQNIKRKFVGFRLASPTPFNADLFSSLEYNLGTPSRLIITSH